MTCVSGRREGRYQGRSWRCTENNAAHMPLMQEAGSAVLHGDCLCTAGSGKYKGLRTCHTTPTHKTKRASHVCPPQHTSTAWRHWLHRIGPARVRSIVSPETIMRSATQQNRNNGERIEEGDSQHATPPPRPGPALSTCILQPTLAARHVAQRTHLVRVRHTRPRCSRFGTSQRRRGAHPSPTGSRTRKEKRHGPWACYEHGRFRGWTAQ